MSLVDLQRSMFCAYALTASFATIKSMSLYSTRIHGATNRSSVHIHNPSLMDDPDNPGNKCANPEPDKFKKSDVLNLTEGLPETEISLLEAQCPLTTWKDLHSAQRVLHATKPS